MTPMAVMCTPFTLCYTVSSWVCEVRRTGVWEWWGAVTALAVFSFVFLLAGYFPFLWFSVLVGDVGVRGGGRGAILDVELFGLVSPGGLADDISGGAMVGWVATGGVFILWVLPVYVLVSVLRPCGCRRLVWEGKDVRGILDSGVSSGSAWILFASVLLVRFGGTRWWCSLMLFRFRRCFTVLFFECLPIGAGLRDFAPSPRGVCFLVV